MNISFKSIFLLLLSILSCDRDRQSIGDDSITFGIRHDRSLGEYEAVVANTTLDLPDFDPVVFLDYSIGRQHYVATGILITPEWVLTAAHNFFDADEQSAPIPASDIEIKVGNDPNSPAAVLSASQLVFHPTWHTSSQDYEDANDLCLMKLSQPFTEVTPATLHQSDDEVIGAKVWLAGFGDYTEQPGQDESLNPIKHAIENTLDRKVSDLITSDGSQSYTGGLLAIDFDSPDGTVNSLGDDIVNYEEGLLRDGSSTPVATHYEGMAVPGDSGGPLYIKDDGIWKVAGILSGAVADPFEGYIDWNYGGISIFIRVSPAFDWIDEVPNAR